MNRDEGSDQYRVAAVLREVNQALVGAESRSSLETSVCEILAGSEPYVFAWIGEHDPETDAVVVRASAGAGADYLEEIEIDVHSGPTRKGPTATAVRTGDLQVAQDIDEDPDYEPWRDAAGERGFASSAAVPIGDGASEHGVLNLYADRTAAFDAAERELLAELGRTIGNAIDSIQLRDRLASSKQAYERLAERITDAFYAVDDDWTVTYWNERMAERTGVPESTVVGEPVEDLFPDIWAGEAGDHYRTAMETGEPVSFETYVDDPFEYWVEVDVYPDENGLSIISRDVTERKKRERRLSAVVENTRNPIYIKDLDGVYRFVNEAAASLFGLDRERVVGRTDEELFDRESAAAVRGIDREILDSGRPDTRETVRHIDGEKYVFIDNKFPYRDANGDIVGVMGVSVDVSERVEKERELAETSEKLSAVIGAAPDAIVMMGADGQVTMWNEGAEELFGWRAEEVLGEPVPFVPPEKRAEMEALVDSLDSGEPNRAIETTRRTKSGDIVDVSISSAPVEVDGEFVGYMGVIRDISERKEYERRLEGQNRRLEVLNRIVRHDIRNDMQAVGSYAELIAERVDDTELDAYAREVVRGVEHAVELTEAMRDIVEAVIEGGDSAKRVDLGSVLASECEDLASTEVVDLSPPPDSLDVAVRGDELLGSVFRNLLTNAVRHNDADRPVVDVSVEQGEEYVTVRVADDGPGMSDELKASAFEKGQRAGDDSGTGIGLYLVRTLVEGYGGDVWAEDNEPTGTVVCVELPLAD